MTVFSSTRIPTRLAPVALALIFSAGCSNWTPLLDEGSAAANPAYGLPGPRGAVHKTVSLRIRHDESIPVDLVVPAAAADESRAGDTAFTPVLLLQGGLVTAERYNWLAAHLASRGAFVLMPHHVGDLAFFEQSAALDILYAARALARDAFTGDFVGLDPDAPADVMGHSLGGVVASKTWLAGSDDVEGLVLLASIPDPADDNTVRRDGHILAIAAENDTRIGPDEIREALPVYRAPVDGVVVRGFNHFGFVDDNTEDNLASDGPLEVDLEIGRERALFFIDALRDGDLDALSNPARFPDGVSAL